MPTPTDTLIHYTPPGPSLRAACGEQDIRNGGSDLGKVTCFACRKTEEFKQAQLEDRDPVTLGQVMRDDPYLAALQLRALAAGQRQFRITVDVFCDSIEEAEQVAAERLGPDEDYGFTYQFMPHTVREINTN